MSNQPENTITLRVSRLRSRSCVTLLQDKFISEGFFKAVVQPGKIIVPASYSSLDISAIQELLTHYGFQLINDNETILVEEIKQAIHELIYELNNVNSVVRKSEYLVEKLNRSYASLSKIFNKHVPVTLEKYIIFQKIERIRELIDQEDLSLGEIAFMMDYNSVQYLSSQFKLVTGISVSDYKKTPQKISAFLDTLSLIE